MPADRELMRMGLAALGYEVKEINITGAKISGALDGALAPIPRFVSIGWRGALWLTIGSNVRRGTSREKYFLRQAGELSFYNGIRSKPEFVFARNNAN